MPATMLGGYHRRRLLVTRKRRGMGQAIARRLAGNGGCNADAPANQKWSDGVTQPAESAQSKTPG